MLLASVPISHPVCIYKPGAFKSSPSDTYVIFGEAKMGDLSSQLQSQVADQFKTVFLATSTLALRQQPPFITSRSRQPRLDAIHRSHSSSVWLPAAPSAF
jgi:hypothetical protein